MATQVLDCQVFSSMPRSNDGPEVMPSSLQNMQHFVNLLSQKQRLQAQDEHSHISDTAAADLKKVIRLIGRLGHARYRRPPGACSSTSSPPSLPQMPTSPACSPLFQSPSSSAPRDVEQRHVRFSPVHVPTQPKCISDRSSAGKVNEQDGNGSVYDATTSFFLERHGDARCRAAASAQKAENLACATVLPSSRPCAVPDQAACGPFKTNSSFVSSLSVEEKGCSTVSSGKPLFSSARPPLPPKKRKDLEHGEDSVRKCRKSGQCHCSQKRRKLHRVMEVKIISVAADAENSETQVPDDGYSWSIYGQKLVEGSMYPRVYYKCSSVRGCPAQKHVQCDSKDKGIFRVTYGRRHVHPRILKIGKA